MICVHSRTDCVKNLPTEKSRLIQSVRGSEERNPVKTCLKLA